MSLSKKELRNALIVFTPEYRMVRDKLVAKFSKILDELEGIDARDLSPVDVQNLRTCSDFFVSQDKIHSEAVRKMEKLESAVQYDDYISFDQIPEIENSINNNDDSGTQN